MKLRSLLFVPADRPERFAKAAASRADAIILDIEDSVALSQKTIAREAVAAFLSGARPCPSFVRVNPLSSGMAGDDLAAILPYRPDAIVFPKAEGANSIATLDNMMRDILGAGAGAALPPILPIATETPAAMFELGSYRHVAGRLIGLTWGAEDLPAAMGAVTGRDVDGRFTPPVEMARSLCLFGAHAAAVAAIETVYPQFTDADGFAAYLSRARRDGFTGSLAIHPAQVAAINAAFSPNAEEIAHAREIVSAFAANPDAGTLQIGGRMVDAPHLKAAQALLARAG